LEPNLDNRIERLLGGQDRLRLRQRLRKHYERYGDQAVTRSLQLSDLNQTEIDTINRLIGRRTSTARSVRLDIAQIDATLQEAGLCASLRIALEKLDGPISHLTELRKTAQIDWLALIEQPNRYERLRSWLQTPSASALLKRLTQQNTALAEKFLSDTEAVLRRLPAPGIARSQLAAQELGNAHALDKGQPIASLVLSAWRHTESVEFASIVADTQEQLSQLLNENESDNDERTRDVWARAGVLVNELARPALTLNLNISGSNVQLGEPAYFSLRYLLRTTANQWVFSGQDIFVCENPNLVAIVADALGANCAPLVCTDGMPAAAQRTLLDRLAHAGARLHYHGDFDWPGVRIANFVLRSWSAQPWQMHAQDYETAVARITHRSRDLTGSDVIAQWDSNLALMMKKYGLTLAEEAVAEYLIADLKLN
jgi:uncharacterized protein (TIGR02679 family)